MAQNNSLYAVVARQRRIALLVFLVVLVAVIAVTLALPKQYESSSTLLVGGSGQAAVSASAGQGDTELAQSYANLLGNKKLEARVQQNIGGPTPQMLATVPTGTQLIQITATAATPLRAASVANAYAQVFIQDVKRFGNVSIAALASPPTAPSAPRPALYVAAGGILAVILAAVAAWARDHFDKRLRTLEELEALLNCSVLGWLPRKSAKHQTDLDGSDALAFVRAFLELHQTRWPNQVIAIASARESDSTAIAVYELANSFSQAATSVIAADFDLRSPRLDVAYGITGGSGISEMLTEGQMPAIHPVTEALDVATAGSSIVDPSAFGKADLSHAIDTIQGERERWLLIRSPPVLEAAASIVASLSGGVLLVVDQRSAYADDLRAVRRRLAAAGAPPVGIIVARSTQPLGTRAPRRQPVSGKATR